ncbi:glycosaminoglycan xylosylkinase-like isoform X2 [Homarus americanus]|uniref:glycosaminoglycan xylosylkinase-like isoform X2 n=1 Tax=Homarus americanus TaxID=6706 RepID=UPI001C488D5D|nr:glycosaminoglycan xylosylkinase-like isoform X2 [Homarus americanus]
MRWVRRVVMWMAWCAAVTAAINLLLVVRVPPASSPLHHHHRTLSPSTVPSNDPVGNKVYLQGEVYAIRDSEYHRRNQRNCSGLQMLNALYTHLPAVRAQYKSPSSYLTDLVNNLKRDITRRRVTGDPWDLARKWAKPRSLVPDSARGLGDVLAALSTAPIIAADVGYKGTQLKVAIMLKGGQKAVFKPKWYPRDEVIEGEVYAGADRHNGEIAAFHLSRLLGFPMVPLAVGRSVSLKRQILPVASRKLAATFFLRRGGRLCFYGVCYYCHKDSSVCDNGRTLEGTIILWLPQRLPLMHLPHPWAHTYKRTKLAQWEENENYCERVLHHPPFNSDKSPRLLDLMDTAVFDFLIQNGDRHHYTVVSDEPSSSVVLLDNGKRLRQTTYERLILLSGGGLSRALQELLAQDPIFPVLTKPHLLALDRRVLHVLAALSMCKEQRGGWHNVLY